MRVNTSGLMERERRRKTLQQDPPPGKRQVGNGRWVTLLSEGSTERGHGGKCKGHWILSPKVWMWGLIPCSQGSFPVYKLRATDTSSMTVGARGPHDLVPSGPDVWTRSTPRLSLHTGYIYQLRDHVFNPGHPHVFKHFRSPPCPLLGHRNPLPPQCGVWSTGSPKQFQLSPKSSSAGQVFCFLRAYCTL